MTIKTLIQKHFGKRKKKYFGYREKWVGEQSIKKKKSYKLFS